MSAPDKMKTGGDDIGPFNVYLHKNGNLSWSFVPENEDMGYTVEDGELHFIRADAAYPPELVEHLKAMPYIEWAKTLLDHIQGQQP